MKFTKMHGCGNDYIYFNCFNQEINNLSKLAITLSDRHKGIGGDGIVIISRSEVADAKMRMFNADGSEGKMCGNAIRCVCKYLYDNKMVSKNPMIIETLSGLKTCKITLKNNLITTITVDMGVPSIEPQDIPVLLDKPAINHPLKINNVIYEINTISIGNPHQVIFVNELYSLRLNEIGPLFEKHRLFPEKVNTEFVKVISKTTLEMRVWERGSGETMACGTGACAAVVIAIRNGLADADKEITVRLLGGELYITYKDDHVYMRGEAVKVFEGEIDYED